jgi:hypothetical protein
MRALGDPRRKTPVEAKKEEAPKTEAPATEETKQTDEFDQSVTIS